MERVEPRGIRDLGPDERKRWKERAKTLTPEEYRREYYQLFKHSIKADRKNNLSTYRPSPEVKTRSKQSVKRLQMFRKIKSKFFDDFERYFNDSNLSQYADMCDSPARMSAHLALIAKIYTQYQQQVIALDDERKTR